jgi:hypothetical protein
MDMHAYYKQLVGFKIIGFHFNTDDEGDWPCLILKDELTNQQIKVEINMDPEGNGPGFAFISEYSAKEKFENARS